MAGEVFAGDGQRDADSVLAVEVPVVRGGQQGNASDDDAHQPGDGAGHVGGLLSEVEIAEGEAQHEEAVQRDEADDEGRHLAGHQGQEARRSARHTSLPSHVFPQVRAQVQPVRHSDHRQVHTHQKIRHTQMRDEGAKTQVAGHCVDEDTVHEAAEVSQQSQRRKEGEEDAVEVGAEQSVTRGDLVRRSVAVRQIEAGRESSGTA